MKLILQNLAHFPNIFQFKQSFLTLCEEFIYQAHCSYVDSKIFYSKLKQMWPIALKPTSCRQLHVSDFKILASAVNHIIPVSTNTNNKRICLTWLLLAIVHEIENFRKVTNFPWSGHIYHIASQEKEPYVGQANDEIAK